MSPRDKPLVWLRGEVKTPPFSPEARVDAGFLLRRLQRGESFGLPVSRPMPSIAAGCHELRIGDRDHTWRIVYHVAADAIVILDVFSKKTTATRRSVVADCRRRLQVYIQFTHKKGDAPRGKK
jgi:phage-related protein